jgi:hypothetical protein
MRCVIFGFSIALVVILYAWTQDDAYHRHHFGGFVQGAGPGAAAQEPPVWNATKGLEPGTGVAIVNEGSIPLRVDLSPDQKLARAYALCHRPYPMSPLSEATPVLLPRERVDPHLTMPCQAIDRAWEVVTPTQDDISADRDFIFEVARDLK